MSLIRRNSPIPLYYQLKDILTDKIVKGEWSVGDRIPPEAELCKQYEVSRITVRQALEELRREGLIVRKQGKGTFVSIPKIEQNLMGFYSFSNEFRKRGLKAHSCVLQFSILEKQYEACRALGVPLDSKVYYFRRLRYADDTLMAIESTYLPWDAFAGLTREALQDKALYDIMRSDYGIIPNFAEESFGATLLEQEEAEFFGLRVGHASIDIWRKTFSGSDCIEYTIGIVRGDIFRFHVDLRRSLECD